jgi:hypothetical protein
MSSPPLFNVLFATMETNTCLDAQAQGERRCRQRDGQAAYRPSTQLDYGKHDCTSKQEPRE